MCVREGHSLASLLACGGYGDDGVNCETFSEDLGWQLEPFKLTRKRTGHISWSLNNGSVLLMGGLNSDRAMARQCSTKNKILRKTPNVLHQFDVDHLEKFSMLEFFLRSKTFFLE